MATLGRTVLFLNDLTPRAFAAHPHAAMVAEALDARLQVYHVVPSPRDDPGHWSPAAEAARRAAGQAKDRLEQDLTPGQGEVVVQRAPEVREAVLAQIAATRPELVALAAHGREGLTSLDPRSVSDSVLQHAGCPVLCVRNGHHGRARRYQRILLPTDLREESRRALPLVAALARGFDAHVLALHVALPPTLASLSGIPDALEQDATSEAAVALWLERELRGVSLGVMVQAGSPWERILETTRAEQVDLIVVTTHGHDSLRDRVLGSHAERIVRQAHCPVLVA